jgi:hypothetical protein
MQVHALTKSGLETLKQGEMSRRVREMILEVETDGNGQSKEDMDRG